jgi:hypothetical protein
MKKLLAQIASVRLFSGGVFFAGENHLTQGAPLLRNCKFRESEFPLCSLHAVPLGGSAAVVETLIIRARLAAPHLASECSPGDHRPRLRSGFLLDPSKQSIRFNSTSRDVV